MGPRSQRWLGASRTRARPAAVRAKPAASARVADLHGAPQQRERGPEFVVVLVSDAFDGVPWLERVYVAGNLWDADEMGARADMHCYTPAELERRVQRLRAVREAVTGGLDLLTA